MQRFFCKCLCSRLNRVRVGKIAGRRIMRLSIKSSIVLRAAGAVAGLWMCGTGAAWAGGGSGDLVSLQGLLTNPQGTGLCDVFDINPCPIPPTVSQTALQL